MEKSKGKTILVTGISKGLGFDTTKKLLDDGYNVVGISRTYNDEFSDYPSFSWLKYDLSDSQNIERFLKDNLGNQLSFYGYVNNAAYAYDDIITNMNMNKLENMYKINVFSPIAITKFCLRNMLLHKTKGSIVNL